MYRELGLLLTGLLYETQSHQGNVHCLMTAIGF